jgi:hypothetical protein
MPRYTVGSAALALAMQRSKIWLQHEAERKRMLLLDIRGKVGVFRAKRKMHLLVSYIIT